MFYRYVIRSNLFFVVLLLRAVRGRRGYLAALLRRAAGWRGTAAFFPVSRSNMRSAAFLTSGSTVEGYFSIFKRGLVGTFHHLTAQHLQRYVHEFDFRYNARLSL